MLASKKARVILAQPAAGAPPPPRPPHFSRAHGPVRGSGEEAAYRARLRYQALLQDYQELVKEAQAKKARLHIERLRKQWLLAEVKFLRKRYKSMSENPSQTIVRRVRNPAMPPASRTAVCADDAQHRSIPAIGNCSRSQPVHWRQDDFPRASQAIGSSSRSQPMHWRQDGSPRTSRVIDLNEACEPGYDELEMGDHHGYRETLSIDKVRRYPVEGDAAAGSNEVRIPAFWDARSPTGRAGKRKISWQDQLALRV